MLYYKKAYNTMLLKYDYKKSGTVSLPYIEAYLRGRSQGKLSDLHTV